MNEDKQEKNSITNGTEHTNSSDGKYDSGKPHLSYVPSAVIWAIAYIREYGNAKYNSPYNWKSVESDRYVEALLRHVELFRENPLGYDEESGLPHLWHVACNVAFLCDFYQDIFNGELGIKNGDPLNFKKVSPYFKATITGIDEAIEWLYDMKHDIKYDEQAEALDMAIEALGDCKEVDK